MYPIYPPTPTPLPPGSAAPIILDYNLWRIWAFADEAIQIWQTAPNSATQTLQIAAILAIVIAGLFLFIALARSITNDQDVANDK